MSTILINTNGRSRFHSSDNLINKASSLGEGLGKLNVTLNNDDGRPVLKPNRTIIDVVNDFSWYAGPKATQAALNKIPCAFLVEREQLLSSLISGALYYLNAGAQTVRAIGESDYIQSVLGRVGEGSKKVLEGIGSSINNMFDSISDATGSITDQALLRQNNLNSLQGIYFTRPTGFQYRLPMYDQKLTTENEWSDALGGDSAIGGFISTGQRGVENIAQVVNFAQPGTYIEKPRYFQGAGGRTETIKFPLANTIKRSNQSPVQQNYELLWLLAFQNKAYKTSFSRTPPPKIYSINVPGQFSMPYAYISNMSVDFIGTVRKQKVFVPSGTGVGTIGIKSIETPVPEAYEVSLEFTSLIKDYGNTMLGNQFSTSIIDNTVTFGIK
jgi:hypothetical protein